jgi:hypothetical protein
MSFKPLEFPRSNFTMVANALFDIFLPLLPPNAWKILCMMIRQTHGWIDKRPRSTTDGMSVRTIRAMAGIKSLEATVDGLKILVKTKCLIPCTNDKWQPTAYKINADLVIENPQQFAEIVYQAKLGNAHEPKPRKKAKTSPSVSEIETGLPNFPVTISETRETLKTLKTPANSNHPVTISETGRPIPLVSEIVTEPVSEIGFSCKNPGISSKTSPHVSEIVTEPVSEIVTGPVSEIDTLLLNMKERDKETEEREDLSFCKGQPDFNDGTFEIKGTNQEYIILNKVQIRDQRFWLEWSRQTLNVEQNHKNEGLAVAWLIKEGCDFDTGTAIFISQLTNSKLRAVSWVTVRAEYPTYKARLAQNNQNNQIALSNNNKTPECAQFNKAQTNLKVTDDIIQRAIQRRKDHHNKQKGA